MKANFTQEQIAALVLLDKTALYESIMFLCEENKLKPNHRKMFAEAYDFLAAEDDLPTDLYKKFIEPTPYEGRVRITVYHKQLTVYLTQRYSNVVYLRKIAKKLESLKETHPRLFEDRMTRWDRQGQEWNDATNGIGGRKRYEIANVEPVRLDNVADSSRKVIKIYTYEKAAFYAQ